MIDPQTDIAIAGVAITAALLDLLIAKELISRQEARGLLTVAQKRCMDLGSPGAARLCGSRYNDLKDH
jgi:hypothetical protein